MEEQTLYDELVNGLRENNHGSNLIEIDKLIDI